MIFGAFSVFVQVPTAKVIVRPFFWSAWNHLIRSRSLESGFLFDSKRAAKNTFTVGPNAYAFFVERPEIPVRDVSENVQPLAALISSALVICKFLGDDGYLPIVGGIGWPPTFFDTWGVEPSSRFENCHFLLNSDVLGWSSASINEPQRKDDGVFLAKSWRGYSGSRQVNVWIRSKFFLVHCSFHNLLGERYITTSNNEQEKCNYSSSSLKTKCPPLSKLLAFFTGLLLFGYGWWRVRLSSYNATQFIIGFCSAIVGVILLMYGFDGLLTWRLES